MKRLISLMILCVPLIAQVGRYELHEVNPPWSDTDCLLLLDTKTGSIYELLHFGIRIVIDGNEIYEYYFPDSLTVEQPTLSHIEAIEELWRRYKANPVILNDEDVAEVEELRKRWGLIKPKKP